MTPDSPDAQPVPGVRFGDAALLSNNYAFMNQIADRLLAIGSDIAPRGTRFCFLCGKVGYGADGLPAPA